MTTELDPELEPLALVLRHRSGFNPLELNRLLETLAARTDASPLEEARRLLGDPVAMVELRFGLAIEHVLAEPRFAQAMRASDLRRQHLFDALYLLPRRWQRQTGRSQTAWPAGAQARQALLREELSSRIDHQGPDQRLGAPAESRVQRRKAKASEADDAGLQMAIHAVNALATMLAQPSDADAEPMGIDRAALRRAHGQVVVDCLDFGQPPMLVRHKGSETLYWRFDPQGADWASRPGDVREPSDLRVDREALTAVAHWREVFRAVLGAGPDDASPFAVLVRRHGLLSAAPPADPAEQAWRRVHEAVEGELPVDEALAAAHRRMVGFAAMLKARARPSLAVLLIATGVGGLIGRRDRVAALTGGIQALRPWIDSGAWQQAAGLRRQWRACRRLLGLGSLAVERRRLAPAGGPWVEAAAAAFESGRTWGTDQAALGRLAQAAWARLIDRVHAEAGAPGSADTSAPDLIEAVASATAGFVAADRLDPSAWSLADWTLLLLRGFAPPTTDSGEAWHRPPRELLTLALARLGLAALARETRDAVLRRAATASPSVTGADDARSGGPAILPRGAPSQAAGPLVFVVAAEGSPLTGGWCATPRRGLVLVASAQVWRDHAEAAHRLLPDGIDPVLAIEGGTSAARDVASRLGRSLHRDRPQPRRFAFDRFGLRDDAVPADAHTVALDAGAQADGLLAAIDALDPRSGSAAR